MAKRSLFSILSEQPWWVSVLVAAMLFALVQLIFPPVAPFVALPFLAIAAYFAWKQIGTASPAIVAERLTALREMSWEQFGPVIANAYRRRGFAVDEPERGAFDFRLRKDGRLTLVQCRRWKANQVGIGPVQELFNAMDRNDAHDGICIAAGEFSPGAREFAAGKRLALVNGAALADLVGRVGKKDRRWFMR